MEFTGERLVPDKVNREDETSYTRYLEHFSRYVFAAKACEDKIVLDAACGCGYGSHLLATVAAQAVGIDVSPEAIRYSREHYRCSNLAYQVMDCCRLGFRDAFFEAVVAFELIEHILEHEVFLSEVHRVLRKGGIFIASTPNKVIYNMTYGRANPFHLRELMTEEFLDELTPLFSRVTLYGQRVHPLFAEYQRMSRELAALQQQVTELQARLQVCVEKMPVMLLRSLVPRPVRRVLPERIKRRVWGKGSVHHSLPADDTVSDLSPPLLTVRDVEITLGDLDEAMYIIAVCHK